MSDTPRTDTLKIPSEALLLLGQKGIPERIVQAILALGDHARQLERELAAAIAERDAAYAAKDRVVKILTHIHMHLAPPAITLEDGRTMQYAGPDTATLLRIVSDAIRAIPEQLTKEKT